MSRIGYSDDEEYPGQFSLWQANCSRSINSKRGQEAMREVHAALLAMPEKRLISGSIEADGEVCAIGAVIRARGLLDKVDECEETDAQAVALLGFPRLVAWKLVEMNDEIFNAVSPEERYRKVLESVELSLAGARHAWSES